MTVKAMSSFNADGDDEVSYGEGDQLEVLTADSSGWWTVRLLNGDVGLVPAVHLQLDNKSARQSRIFLRNNSLYAKKPPPRAPSLRGSKRPPPTPARRIGLPVKISIDDCDTDPDTENLNTGIEPSHLTDTDMAARNIVPVHGKSRSEGLINYAELVFDKNPSEKQKIVKTTSTKPNKEKEDKIIYTQIVPKGQRKAEDKDSEKLGSGGEKKSDRMKAAVKGFFSKLDDGHRRSPSPPCSGRDRESPVPFKIRQPAPALYENQSITPAQSDSTPPKHTYMNLANLQSNADSSSGSINSNGNSLAISDPGRLKLPRYFLRRSSIDPPPAPTVEAPKPSVDAGCPPLDDNLSPMISRVQAIASYDGPMISGMLMFAKGDIATLISKTNPIGWWYVNLKGLEGYVPGAYWVSYSGTAKNGQRISPPNRRKPPQPMPRSRSPPTTQTPNLPSPSNPSPPQSLGERGSIENEAWYHGRMSRPESEKLLSACGNGDFLIRESVNRIGDLTLSVKWETKVRHFPIEAKEGGLFYIGKHDFKTLQGVISHYSKHALFYTDDNQAVKLKLPAVKIIHN